MSNMELAVNQILPALAKMNEEELKQIHLRASLLLSKYGGSDSVDEQLVFEYVHKVITSTGASLPPFQVFARMPMYVTYKKSIKVFLQFVDEHFKAKKQIDRREIISVLMAMIRRRLERDGIPVATKTVAEALARIGEIVADEFPGYLESGLLPGVLSRRRKR